MNIILAGIPRSGTTLACHLLNQLPNLLALVEPMDMNALMSNTTLDARAEFINTYCGSIRHDVHENGWVVANRVEGSGTNTFSKGGSGKRKASLIGKGVIEIDKPLKNGFDLVIKHPNAFSALLPELVNAFQCFAIVRNPLSVIASWNTLDHPLSRGRAPMAEAFDCALEHRLDEAFDDLDRQLVLLDWYYEQYWRVLGAGNIIRYEDIIASNGQALSVINSGALNFKKTLVSRNNNAVYEREFMMRVYERLAAENSHSSNLFYSIYEVANVLAGY